MPLRSSKRSHVNILMATCNGMPWLKEQLASLLAQTHQDWSLWISDDGSTDGTRETLLAFRRQHPDRVAMIIEGPDRGAAANFLHLLRHSELPLGIVALCDQDDIWLPHKLSVAVEALDDVLSGPAVWAARYVVADEHLSCVQPSTKWPRPPSFGNAIVQNIMSGHTLTLNPLALSLLRQGPEPDIPHHDWWIYLVMASHGARMIHDDRIVLKYRQHGGNLMGARRLARVDRLRGVIDGTLGRWIDQNLRSLVQADVPMSPEAERFITAWQAAGRLSSSLLRHHDLHRQSWMETSILRLVAAAGKL